MQTDRRKIAAVPPGLVQSAQNSAPGFPVRNFARRSKNCIGGDILRQFLPVPVFQGNFRPEIPRTVHSDLPGYVNRVSRSQRNRFRFSQNRIVKQIAYFQLQISCYCFPVAGRHQLNVPLSVFRKYFVGIRKKNSRFKLGVWLERGTFSFFQHERIQPDHRTVKRGGYADFIVIGIVVPAAGFDGAAVKPLPGIRYPEIPD